MEICDVSLEKYLQGQKVEGLVDWEIVRQQGKVSTHAYKIMQHMLNDLIYIHCLRQVHRHVSPHNGSFREFIVNNQYSTFQTNIGKLLIFA